MKKWRVFALALSMLILNLVGISPAQADTFTFDCGSGGTYTVVSGHVTGSMNCSGALTIDSSVTAIDDYAFNSFRIIETPFFDFIQQNPSITNLVIPDSVLSIGSSAFEGMTTMTSISIANSVTTIGRDAFKQNNNVTELLIGSGASLIESDTYQRYQYISKVVVPEGVTRIDPGAFTELHSVTSFSLPSTLTTLGSASLRNMHSLRSINIPTSLSTANDYFAYLTNPASVPYLCSTTGSSATPAVNQYFATLIATNTNAGRCATTFDAPTITSVAFPSSTSATVNFTPPSNYGAGSGISSYAVVAFPGGQRATVSGGSARSITIDSLEPETAYTFEVTAINNEEVTSINGEITPITSPPSARSASLTCCSVSTTAPGAPTIGAATALSPTSALISFTAPTSDGGAAIETYTATSNPSAITGQLLQATSGSITVTGLTPSTAYTFTVTASNSVGSSSASGATISITMPASQAEITAAALAAEKIAEAKRVAEIKAARLDISNLYFNLIIPSYELFSLAQFYSVTEYNLPYISNEIFLFADSDRNNIFMIEKIVKKYKYLDIMCSSIRLNTIYASNLSAVGLFPKANQTSILFALKKLPLTERNSYLKITQVINNQLQVIEERKKRLAALRSFKKSPRLLAPKP